VDPDAVNLQAPIIATWPIGSKVYPARSARLLDPRATQRFYRNYARGVARFESIEEITHDALDETLYRDLPVMEREMNWREGPELDYARKLEVSDFRLGAIVVTDESELAIAQPRFVFTCMNREDCDYLREWIYARKGRCRGIWLPTWCDDLKLTNLVATSSLNIDVEACGLVHFAESEPGRRDIRVQLKNGNVYYRRVTDPSAPNELTERLVLNAVFPEQFEPEDVERISWMHYVRLDADSIELTWATPTQLEAVLPFKGPRNEL
jgi:hypothetical protein